MPAFRMYQHIKKKCTDDLYFKNPINHHNKPKEKNPVIISAYRKGLSQNSTPNHDF